MRQIQTPAYSKSDKLALSGSATSSVDRIDYPIFCFRHLHDDYGVDQCIAGDGQFIRQLFKKIQRVSGLSWTDIQFANRKGNGTEKIAKSSIKKSIPISITEDVKDFLSFYFNGTKGRMIGFRNKMIFHIVYIDTKLDVYRH